MIFTRALPEAQPLGECPVCRFLPGSDASRPCASCGTHLVRHSEGWWNPPGRVRQLAYPEDGADLTFQVEETSFWFAHRNRVLLAMLGRFPPSGTIWDVGAGNGFPAQTFERAGFSVVALEPGACGCRHAVGRGLRRVVCSSLEGLKLLESSVQAVSLLDVIEHLDDPVGLLAECRRVLAPGGRLYVTVPACELLWSDEDIYARHRRRYDCSLLHRHLMAARFRVEFLSYFFQALLGPLFLLRTLPYLIAPWRTEHQGTTMEPSEHNPGGWAQQLLEWALSRELGRLKRGWPLRFGTSVVAVAS